MTEGSRKVQYVVGFAVALASMTSSVAFSWTTPIIPKFHNNESGIIVTDTDISWIVVSSTPGVMAGTIATQYLSDTFGRRSSILASVAPFIIGTIFVLLKSNVWMLYVARFLWGVGAGIVQTVAMIYVAEIASKEIRGSLTVVIRYLFNFGAFLVIAIGSFVSYQTLSYMLIVLPMTYFLACAWIPESPYYLLKEGKVESARKQLRKLNGYKDKKIQEQKLTEMHRHVMEDMRRSTSIKELFTGMRYRKALIIAIGLRVCQLMSGTIPIQQYLGRIIQETKSSLSVTTGLISFAALRFFVSMLSSVLVDRIGRRPLLIFSFAGGCVSLLIVGTCFYMYEVIVFDKYPNLFGNIIFICITVFSVASNLGYETLVYVVPVEIFPMNVKSIAMTSMNLFGGLVTFFILRGYQIIKDIAGLYTVFWSFACVCLIGALFSYFMIPETKGKSLREIQIELQGSLYEEYEDKIDVTKNEDVETILLPIFKDKTEDVNDK